MYFKFGTTYKHLLIFLPLKLYTVIATEPTIAELGHIINLGVFLVLQKETKNAKTSCIRIQETLLRSS